VRARRQRQQLVSYLTLYNGFTIGEASTFSPTCAAGACATRLRVRLLQGIDASMLEAQPHSASATFTEVDVGMKEAANAINRAVNHARPGIGLYL